MRSDYSPGDEIGPLCRFMAVTGLVWPMLGLYLVINHSHAMPPARLEMPAWVPFWPAFTLPYLAMMPATWLLPVAIRDAARFRACLWTMLLAYLLVMPWWILTPSMLPRPPVPAGWWAFPYQWLVTVDAPNNVMPCAHGTGIAVAAWFAGQDHPRWRWPLAVMLAVGLPSIALVWQHRPVDILLGTVAAAIAVAAGEVWRRRTRAVQVA